MEKIMRGTCRNCFTKNTRLCPPLNHCSECSARIIAAKLSQLDSGDQFNLSLYSPTPGHQVLDNRSGEVFSCEYALRLASSLTTGKRYYQDTHQQQYCKAHKSHLPTDRLAACRSYKRRKR